MKTTAVLVASAAALANAQATYNSTTGKFDCAKANVAYCSGDSLKSDIIIRCDSEKVGQWGRCSDNLDGEPPVGNYPALCWQTSETSGDAACEKNCVVYGGSGNYPGTFTLPSDDCSPTYTASASASGVISSASVTATGTERTLTATSSSAGASDVDTTTVVDATSTTTTCPESSAATTTSPAVVSPPLSTGVSTPSSVVPAPPLSTGVSTPSSVVPAPPLSTGSGGGSGSGNGTVPSGSNTPVGPTSTTSTPSTVPTAGAAVNQVGGLLAFVGFFAAYFL